MIEKIGYEFCILFLHDLFVIEKIGYEFCILFLHDLFVIEKIGYEFCILFIGENRLNAGKKRSFTEAPEKNARGALCIRFPISHPRFRRRAENNDR